MLVTLATIPACLAVVTLLKDLGLPTKWAALMSVVVGVVLAFFDLLAGANYNLDLPTIVQTASTGLVLGLSAAGLYDASRLIGNATADSGELKPSAPEETTPQA